MKNKNKFFYDWVSNGSYGGGGHWKYNRQRFINLIIFILLFINFLLILFK